MGKLPNFILKSIADNDAQSTRWSDWIRAKEDLYLLDLLADIIQAQQIHDESTTPDQRESSRVAVITSVLAPTLSLSLALSAMRIREELIERATARRRAGTDPDGVDRRRDDPSVGESSDPPTDGDAS